MFQYNQHSRTPANGIRFVPGAEHLAQLFIDTIRDVPKDNDDFSMAVLRYGTVVVFDKNDHLTFKGYIPMFIDSTVVRSNANIWSSQKHLSPVVGHAFATVILEGHKLGRGVMKEIGNKELYRVKWIDSPTKTFNLTTKNDNPHDLRALDFMYPEVVAILNTESYSLYNELKEWVTVPW